jgi:outer membrane protein assembly factor BamB
MHQPFQTAPQWKTLRKPTFRLSLRGRPAICSGVDHSAPRRARRVLLAIACCVYLYCLSSAAVPATFSADWPTFRADASRSGFTSEPLPNRLRLRWMCRAPHPPERAWPNSERMPFDQVFRPIVVEDLVLFGSSSSDNLTAIRIESGRVAWQYVTDGPIRFAPVAWKDRVFVASDDGHLYALSRQTGQLLWKFRGGPNDRKIIGNGRVISRWPARGGPVVADDVVYFAAGIWPSDGVYLYALEATNGAVRWANDRSGGIEMNQPHGGARAKSGVSAQGYLLVNRKHVFVPTGRAVPAAFDRADGELAYYHLQDNQFRGGSRALLSDSFLINSGCLFHQASGLLASHVGIGPIVATPNGIVRTEGRSLAEYRWQDLERVNPKGTPEKTRALKKVRLSHCEQEVLELIVAGNDAVLGEAGRVAAMDYTRQSNTWWSHKVEGQALGLAYGNGHLVVTTDRGYVYCFDGGDSQIPTSTTTAESDSHAASSCDASTGSASAAEQILKQTGISSGYCVDIHCGDGQLAVELAKRSNLRIYAVDSNPQLVEAARHRCAEAGLYGTRISVHVANPGCQDLPARFANLVVSANSLTKRVNAESQETMRRLARPFGGVVCWGPADNLTVTSCSALEGAGQWTHQNADAANTLCSNDHVAKGPLEMLWFRDVDFRLPNRHGQGPAPLFANGVLVAGGVDGLCAVDAYNGHTLWKFSLPGNLRDYDGIHHDVGVGETGSNFCLGDGSVFVTSGRKCLRIDLVTGQLISTYNTPVADDADNQRWGFLAYSDGRLFGSVANQRHKVSARYRLIELTTESTSLFALHAASGSLLWHFHPQHSIRNNSIAVGQNKVFLVDRPLVKTDRIDDPQRDGKHRPRINPDEQPPGTLIALDAASGVPSWQSSEDIFGTQLAVSEQHGVLLMNYQAVRHSFFQLPSEIGGRMAGFATATGQRLWDIQAKYQTRPLLNDDAIYTQNGAWDLKTGQPLPFALQRSYGCGQISGSTHLLLFRSATLGYRDFSRSAGTENYGGIRPGCWINAIPAGGLVLVPNGATRCRCSYQMQSWLALQPCSSAEGQ